MRDIFRTEINNKHLKILQEMKSEYDIEQGKTLLILVFT